MATPPGFERFWDMDGVPVSLTMKGVWAFDTPEGRRMTGIPGLDATPISKEKFEEMRRTLPSPTSEKSQRN